MPPTPGEKPHRARPEGPEGAPTANREPAVPPSASAPPLGVLGQHLPARPAEEAVRVPGPVLQVGPEVTAQGGSRSHMAIDPTTVPPSRGPRGARGQIPAFPFLGCVTRGKWLNLSGSQGGGPTL